MARFKREAQVLASLNHPNIAGRCTNNLAQPATVLPTNTGWVGSSGWRPSPLDPEARSLLPLNPIA